jgi:hypothetical protein
MAKRTQNAVLTTDGSRFRIAATVASVIGFLTEYNGLRYVQAVNAEKQPLFLDDAGAETLENTGKPLLKARPRSGYDKYFNDDGFVNPISPEALSPQGVGKLMAKLVEVAYTIVGQGGADGKEMSDILVAIGEYSKVAPEMVAKRAKAKQLADAIASLGEGVEADTLREIAKSQGIELPPAPIAASASVPDSAIETVEDEADTNETVEDELEAATRP